jgi:hypothetical protein
MEPQVRRSRFAKLSDPGAAEGDIDWNERDDDRKGSRIRGGHRRVDDRDRDRDRERDREYRPRSFLNAPMKMGLAALAIGGVLTLLTYQAADANHGTYYVFKGAMVIGVIQIVRGLMAR